MKNIEFRKKAINKMMSEKPSISVSKKKKGEGPEAFPTPKMAEMDKHKESEDEYVSMMVTPEEKEMLEKMRSKDGKGSEDDEDFEE